MIYDTHVRYQVGKVAAVIVGALALAVLALVALCVMGCS